MFGSCWSRNPGWSNAGVNWIDAGDFRDTCKHWRRISDALGNSVTIRNTPQIGIQQFGKNDSFLGNTTSVAGNHSCY